MVNDPRFRNNIEDVCESHGATHNGQKAGSFGWISNFSFYYAHHMSTIEGGMVCTDSEEVYQTCRMLRSHGMVREATNQNLIKSYVDKNPDLNPEFIFAFPGFNMRNNELGAVLGRNQLARLDVNNEKRRKNFEIFLELLEFEEVDLPVKNSFSDLQHSASNKGFRVQGKL